MPFKADLNKSQTCDGKPWFVVLGVSITVFSERYDWIWKSCPECRLHLIIGWSPGLNKKERASWVLAFVSHSFLAAGVLWPAASRPWLPYYDGLYLQTVRQNSSSFGCFWQAFWHRNEKTNMSINKTVALNIIYSNKVLYNVHKIYIVKYIQIYKQDI